MIPVIPVIPSLALALFSFISSVFVVLRTLLPVLPPHPLSRRVPRSAFGLPRRSLSPAQRSTIYIAAFDILALSAFVWQVAAEYLAPPSAPATAARLWLALTARQACLLIVAVLTLWNVRRGQTVSYGIKDFYVWGSAIFLIVVSTAVASAFAGVGISTLYGGLVIYSSSVALLTTAAFGCLFGSFYIIRRNLAVETPWPPATGTDTRIITPTRRPGSFATEDIEELKEGASWITSRHSQSQSLSAFSFSTHSSAAAPSSNMNPFGDSNPSLALPRKSSYWFSAPTSSEFDLHNVQHPTPAIKVPPVPPLPSPYGSGPMSPPILEADSDPFRRASPPRKKAHSVKSRSSSWLTSPSASMTTLSAFSYPTTHRSDGPKYPALSPAPYTLPTATSPTAFSPRPSTEMHEIRLSDEPLIIDTEKAQNRRYQDGGYNYAEKGQVSFASHGSDDSSSVTLMRSLGWVLAIWVPLSLSLPYLLLQSSANTFHSPIIPVLLILSVTLSSPLLALHVMFSSPLPFYPAVFLHPTPTPSLEHLQARAFSPADTSASGSLPYDMVHKNSSQATVVESRKSSDVWLEKGDAVDGKGKFGRAFEMLHPVPKLSVLPLDHEAMDDDDTNDSQRTQTPLTFTFPLSIRTSNAGYPTRDEMERYRMSSDPVVQAAGAALAKKAARKAEMERESQRKRKASSVHSVEKTKIMIAERHVSTMAMTVVMPKSPVESQASWSSSVARQIGDVMAGHLRSRSVSSAAPSTSTTYSKASATGSTAPISPPPSFPLPPTPPSVRRLKHARSQSSSALSLGAVLSELYDIESLSAALRRKKRTTSTGEIDEVEELIHAMATPVMPLKTKKGPDWSSESKPFESPENHSTPVQEARKRKDSRHKRAGHYSLPSLGLSMKDGSYSLSKWKAELDRALAIDREFNLTNRFNINILDDGNRRRTVWGGESTSELLDSVEEEEPKSPVVPEYLPLPTAVNRLSVETGALTNGGGSTTPYENSIQTPSPAPTDRFIVQQSEPKATPLHARPQEFVGKSKAFHLPQRSASRVKYIKSNESQSPSYEDDNSNDGYYTPSNDQNQDNTRRVQNTHQPRVLAHPADSPLRPLSLVQGRNQSTPTFTETPPLRTSKKEKEKDRAGSGKKKENVVVTSTPASKLPRSASGMKPLQLVRSATSKARGLLREEEILPEVVVRPPSSSIHNGFGYSFR